MRIKVIDAPIPEGYTYRRTDRFTAEEFVQELKAGQREAARAWTRAHPKEIYTLADVMQFHNDAPTAGRKGRRTDHNRPAVSKTAEGYFVSGRTTKRYSVSDDRY